MRHPYRFVSLGLIVVLLATACSSADVAATVDGVEIVDGQVLALAVQDENSATVDTANPCQGQQGAAPDQPCVGFRDDLTVLIFLEAMVAAAADDFGITGIGTEASREEFLSSASAQAQQVLDTLVGLPGRSTQAFENVIIDQLDVRTRVLTALAHDEQNLMGLWDLRSDPQVAAILPATYEELASDPERWVPQEAVDFWWSQWIDTVAPRSDVSVRSQIGSWIAEDGIIAPPPASP